MNKTMMIAGAALVSGCVTTPPLVNMTGVDAERYGSDLAYCKEISGQRELDKIQFLASLNDAMLGARYGTSFGGFTLRERRRAAYQESIDKQVKQCLAARGYSPLSNQQKGCDLSKNESGELALVCP